MRILFFGTYNDRVHPRVAVLREGLEALGNSVDVCNVALGVPTSERVRMIRQPWRALAFFARLLAAWIRLWRKGRRIPTPDVVVVGYLGILDVQLARRLWPNRIVVLDHLAPSGETAKDRGAGELIQRALGWVDRLALNASDVVCVDTAAHLPAAASAGDRVHTVVVPVGASAAWFQAPKRLPSERLRVIFFGLYTPLQGAPTIGAAIRLLARSGTPVEFTMVGGGQDRRETVRRACYADNVRWIDWVRPPELPRMVSRHHVCLGIFGYGEKAQKVVPNKVYQGCAAGCAVVTSDTPPQREVLGDAAWYVRPGEPQELADALSQLSRDDELLESLRRRAFDRAEQRFRATVVASSLQDRLERMTPSRPEVSG